MSGLIYRIAMSEPNTHLFEVEVALADAPAGVIFRMPAWTPGSYLVREYSRHVQDVTALDRDGVALDVAKIDKASWKVLGLAEGGAVTLRYRVYAHDLTVRTSHLTGAHGYFNGASVFMCPEGFADAAATLEVTPYGEWTCSIALPQLEGPGFRYAVEDFDQLVDSPGECGTHREITFEAAGVNHRWAVWGPGAEQWHGPDGARALGDVKTLIETEVALFGDLPADVEDYLFIVHLKPERGGGLEHKNSQTIHVSSDALREPKDYEDFLTLVAHEYFHVWNVKRIRAEHLGPFDYSREAYTPLLWMMEGITAFYDTMIPARAGLIAPDRYLELLGERLATCRNKPGRGVRSLEQSSYDAWIKLYHRDENTDNTAVSYYLKGELAIACLDLHLRAVSDGERSFDDVMRLLWMRQKETGAAIRPGDVADLFQAATGVDLTSQLAVWVEGTDDLPLESLLQAIGLEVTPSWKAKASAKPFGPKPDPAGRPWLGITTQQRASGGTFVATVRTDGPASGANLYPDDELVAVDGRRVGADWDDRMKVYDVGDEVELLVFRRKAQQTARVTLAQRPADTFSVSLAQEGPSGAHKTALSAWLGARASELWDKGE